MIPATASPSLVERLRPLIVAEIMTLVRPSPVPMDRKPTVEELEAILNSETTDQVYINPDGSVACTPQKPATVGDVADACLRIVSEALTAAPAPEDAELVKYARVASESFRLRNELRTARLLRDLADRLSRPTPPGKEG